MLTGRVREQIASTMLAERSVCDADDTGSNGL